jgi:hypothetical protein
LFFFENEKDALRANTEWNFNYPNHYLCSFVIDERNITRVDSNWITNFLSSHTEDTNWMEKYWSGIFYNDNPLIELIVNGTRFIDNIKLREEAYKIILDTFPGSSRLLSASCCLFKYGRTKCGQISPFLLLQNNSILGKYLIYLGDLEDPTIQPILQHCIKNNEIPIFIPHPDPNISFQLPNLEGNEFRIEINDHTILELFPHLLLTS